MSEHEILRIRIILHFICAFVTFVCMWGFILAFWLNHRGRK